MPFLAENFYSDRLQPLLKRLGDGPWLILAVSITIPLLGLPVYFRGDDSTYLRWAQSHSLAEVFQPSQAVLFGVFRPMQNLTWWLLYRAFGLNPYAYQLLLASLFVGSMYFFYQIIRREGVVFPGILAVAAFFVPFHFLLYFLFWYSDLTFGIELFFVTGSVFFLAGGLNGDYQKFIWGAIFAVIAFFSKEPSLIIIPSFVACYLIGHWRDVKLSNRVKWTMLLSAPLVPVIFLKLFSYASDRAANILSLNLPDMLNYLRMRYEFYGARLMGFPAGIMLLSCAMGVVFSKAVRLWARPEKTSRRMELGAILLALVAAGVVYRQPAISHTIFLASIMLAALLYLPISYAVAWFVLPFSLLLTVDFITQTYLLEAVYGLAIFLAFALSKLLATAVSCFPRKISETAVGKKSALASLAAGAIVISLLAMPRAKALHEELQLFKTVRHNFRDMVQYVAAHCESGAEIYLIDYELMGLRDIDFYTKSNHEKIRLMKTMWGGELATFLNVLGRNDLHVKMLSERDQNGAQKNAEYILAYNRIEDGYVIDTRMSVREVFKIDREHESAVVYKIAF
jgi:hypothetical protein